MHDLPSLVIVGLLGPGGFALLALSQQRHWKTVMASAPCPCRKCLRIAGFAAEIICLGWLVRSQGAGFGTLLWGLNLSASAFGVALLLSWRPQWLRIVQPGRGRPRS